MEPMASKALHARFLRGLEKSPAGVAVRVGGDTVDYTTAHATALAWAGALLAAPGGPPNAVGILTGRSTTAYLGILAALYAGLPAVPIPAGFPVGKVVSMLGAAGVSALVVDGEGAALLAGGTGAELGGLPVLAPHLDRAGAEALAAPPGCRYWPPLRRPRSPDPGTRRPTTSRTSCSPRAPPGAPRGSGSPTATRRTTSG